MSLFLLKGFLMGMADIVPGVSGGTVALILGVYRKLVASISSFDMFFIRLLLKFEFKKAFNYVNGAFLLALFTGAVSAMILMSHLIHFFLNTYAVFTWSLFFGLILASIVLLLKQVKRVFQIGQLALLVVGVFIGYIIVSFAPVESSTGYAGIFFSGCLAICAMILPGISGAFILLLLGKYAFMTSVLKTPFSDNHLFIIFVFGMGCLLGILSFSKILNFLLQKYYNATLCVLVGFMLGSLKKIWPWREVLQQKIVGQKIYILSEKNILPSFDLETILAIVFVLTGIFLVILVDKISKRGVSSAG